MGAKKAKAVKFGDFELRCVAVRQLMREGVAREDIRHELTHDTSSSGGRADLVCFVQGRIVGFEIKSCKDTLKLLPGQLHAMERAFDAGMVIASARHIEGLKNFYSADCATYCPQKETWVCRYSELPQTNKNVIMNEIISRRGEWRNYRTSHTDMLCLLWRDEVVRIAARLGLKHKTRFDAIRALKEEVPLKTIRPAVIDALRTRQPSRWEAGFWMKYDSLNSERKNDEAENQNA